MENQNQKFVNGLFVNVRENQPEFVVCNLSIKRDKFVEWINQQKTTENGYVSVDLLKSKDGSRVYASLNTYEPKEQQAQEPTIEQVNAEQKVIAKAQKQKVQDAQVIEVEQWDLPF